MLGRPRLSLLPSVSFPFWAFAILLLFLPFTSFCYSTFPSGRVYKSLWLGSFSKLNFIIWCFFWCKNACSHAITCLYIYYKLTMTFSYGIGESIQSSHIQILSKSKCQLLLIQLKAQEFAPRPKRRSFQQHNASAGRQVFAAKPRNGTWDFFLMFFGTYWDKHVDVHQLKLSLPLKTYIYIYNIDILEYAGFVRGSAVWYTTLAFACHRVKH